MKIINIAGRLGKDPELRRTGDGDRVLSFSVAVDDGYGERKSTMWFDCSVWGKRAGALEPHLSKGSAVAISGDLGKREHDGKTYLTIRVGELTMLDSKGDDAPAKTASRQERDDPRTQPRELDDDIPF